MSDLWAHTSVVVPFRLGSQRFPNKALCVYRGRTLVEHALINAAALGPARLVLTAPAADLDVVRRALDLSTFDVTLVVSGDSCSSATQRLVEIAPQLPGEFFVSLPIDEPAVDPNEIRRALQDPAALDGVEAVTFHCDFFAAGDYESALSAKVITDHDGRLLYLSRAVIPVRKDGSVDPSALKKNVGVFLFARAFLVQLAAHAGTPTELDRHEGLEQLRWLELGLQVRCLPIRHIGFGIDVPQQVALLEERTGWR